jgi:streptogramin lyase
VPARLALLVALLALAAPGTAHAVFIQEYSSGFRSGPPSMNPDTVSGIALGPDGNIWVVNKRGNSLARVKVDGTIEDFLVNDSGPDLHDVTVGPDGNLWVSSSGNNGAYELNTNGAVVDAHVAGDPDLFAGDVHGIAATAGHVWLLAFNDGKLTRLAPDGSSPTEFARPTGSRFVRAIDGKIWTSSPNSVQRLDIDGNVEATFTFTGKNPADMALGADGRVWIALSASNEVAAVSKTSTGSGVATYSPGAGNELDEPTGVALGPDGNVWVTSRDNDKVAKVTPAGTITTYGGLTTAGKPFQIVAGPDNDLWLTELWGARVARVLPDQPPRAQTGGSEVPNPTSATVHGAVASRGANTSVVFEYGTTTAYGASVAAAEVLAGVGVEERLAVLSGLAPNTTYHYRVKATSPHGTTTGEDKAFKTPAGVSGVDNDQDGISPPADCDDSNPAIRPGARDIPGNGIDEDCNDRDAPFPLLRAEISSAYRVFGTYTTLRALTVKSVPKGATIRILCKGRGCPKGRKINVTKARKQISLLKYVRGSRLRPKARLEVRVTAPRTIGRVRRITSRAPKLPRVQSLCLRPGAKKPHGC